MPEILTESFCERCGTRYTFESATPRGPRLKGLKVMSRGLKNFVLSDDTSMDEAMAAARNETDREQTAQQLDAFHKTFNFCMSCRQYTCGNCWNEADGQCLSCAPHLGHEVLPAPFGNVGAGGAVTLTGSEAIGLHDRNGNGTEAPASAEPMAWPEAERMAWPEPEPMAWPTSDLTHAEGGADGARSFQEVVDAAARLDAVAGPADVEPAVEEVAPPIEAAPPIEEVAPPVEAAQPVEAAVEPEAEAIEAITAAAQAAPPPPATPDVPAAPAPAVDQADDLVAEAAANTGDLLRRFRPGESVDDEIAAYEREQIAVASAAMAAAAEAAAAEADAAEAAALAAAEVAAAEARAAAQAAVAEERAAAEVEARAAAEAQARAAAQAAAEAEARAAAEAQARVAAEAQEAAARAAAEDAAAEAAAARAAAEAAAAAEPRDDVVYQPTWQIVAPEPPTADQLPGPQQPSIPPSPSTGQPIAASAEPQWPSRPEWPRPPSADGLPLLGRPVAASGGIEALWAESAREVAAVGPSPGTKPAGGVQPCVSCGLSLSANARFCRRCGTQQG